MKVSDIVVVIVIINQQHWLVITDTKNLFVQISHNMKTITLEGVQYGCGDCDHEATILDSINKHKESTHKDFSKMLRKNT